MVNVIYKQIERIKQNDKRRNINKLNSWKNFYYRKLINGK